MDPLEISLGMVPQHFRNHADETRDRLARGLEPLPYLVAGYAETVEDSAHPELWEGQLFPLGGTIETHLQSEGSRLSGRAVDRLFGPREEP